MAYLDIRNLHQHPHSDSNGCNDIMSITTIFLEDHTFRQLGGFGLDLSILLNLKIRGLCIDNKANYEVYINSFVMLI